MKQSSHISCWVFLLPMILLLMASCSEDDQHVLSLLEKAETYLPEKPDSAEMCLDSIAQPANLSESDKALFGLLRSATDNRQGKGVKSDSLIRDSYEYFHKSSQQGNSSDSLLLCRYAQSCYYMSLYYASCDSTKQREDMLRLAIKCSERGKDWHTCYLAYTQLGKSILLSNPEHAITLSKKALSTYYKINDDINNEILILGHIAGAYLTNAEPDSSLKYCSKGKILAQKHGLIPSYQQMCIGIAEVLLYQKLYESALYYAKLGTANADSTSVPLLFVTLARCYQACDSLKQAHELYSAIKNGNTNSALKYFVFKGLSEMAIQEHKYDAISTYTDSVRENLEDKFLQSQSVKDEYYQSNIKKELEKEKIQFEAESRKLKLKSAILLVIVIASFIIYIIVQEKKRQAEEHEKAMKSKDEEIQNQKDIIHQKALSIASLQNHLLTKLENISYALSTNEKVAMTQEDWKEIEELINRTDDNFVKRLRRQYKGFKEEDIQLCMLVRLRLDNSTMANIFRVSVSAIKKRKLTLKRNGFQITDATTHLEDVIEQL